MTVVPRVQLRTLGGIDLQDAHGLKLVSVLAQSKRLALLVYIAVGGGDRFVRRDVVVSHFWPELDAEHARGALRQALSYLRRSLGDGVIVARGEEIGIDPSAISVDSIEFTSACAAGRHEEAMALYRGDFLEGFFVSDASPELDRWLDEERDRLRKSALVACRALARESLDRGDTVAAVDWARRAAAHAPDDEAELRVLIQLLDDVGDRAGAVRAFDEFTRRLAADYDIEPSPETQATIQRVRSRLDPAPLAAATDSAGRIATASGPSPAPVSAPTPLAARIDSGALQPPPEPRPARARARTVPLTYLTIVGILALAGYVAVLFAGRSPDPRLPLRLAVLPIADVDSDTSRDYVAEGLTDQLITEFAQLPGLEVINGWTMRTYRGSKASTSEILRQLNASAALMATIQSLGDTVHMSVQLVRAGGESASWAKSYHGTRAELLRLQRQIARSAASSLNIRTADRATATRGPTDAAAIDLYIRGRHWWNRRTREALLRSIDFFAQAEDIDPMFAPAYSGMGDAYVQLGYGSLLRPDDAFPKARAAAQQALELDSTLAEPHATLAFVAMYYDWRWDQAAHEFKRALDLNPSYATAHEWYGLFLTAMGRFGEAREEERRAQALDPLSVPIAATAGWVLHYSGLQDDAQRELQVVLRQDSAFPLGRLYLGRVYQARGQLGNALAEYAATGPLLDWIPTVAAVGTVLAEQGREREARLVLARMDSLGRTAYVTAYAYALVHAALGQTDSAFAWLDRAVTERTHWLVWLNRDTRWGKLKDDPRFTRLTAQVGLPR